MQLEDYFDFLDPDDIRLKGTRVGIETVIYAFQEGFSPEEIMQDYPSLSLEQVYATITYYLHNQADVEAYLARLEAWAEQRRQEREEDLPPVVRRLRALRAQIRQGVVSQHESSLSSG